MKLSDDQIKDISDELQAGFKVYINKDTGEIRSIYDFDFLSGVTDLWEEELSRIKKNWLNYCVIRGMEAWELFEIMEDFIHKVENENLVAEIHNALKNKKSFARFRTLVEGSEYKKKWYKFRRKRYIKYVREQLKKEGLMV
ncbi:MAG: hypothetical protein JSV24_00460 [Bacteroidales bacterium]|nr:MAG: hypothetical protein JSV24_00460 [Bacteroidales bacterium]